MSFDVLDQSVTRSFEKVQHDVMIINKKLLHDFSSLVLNHKLNSS
jgi:hypothetical protein